MRTFFESLAAFNQNGLVYLAHTVSGNLWYLLIAVAAVVSIFLYLKEEIVVTVREEQRAL